MPQTPDQLAIQVGQLIRQNRKAKKLSQQELGDLCDLTRTSITNIEQGRQNMPLATFFRICRALGVQAWDMLPDLYEE